ncbi:hypothetical protein AB0764_10485 [Priestia megaterium]
MKRDLDIRLMEMKAEGLNKQLEFNMKMYELKRKITKLDSIMGGMKR